MRINKFISHNTKYSRREADELIKQGKVKINTKLATLSTDVGEEDKIFVDGKFIKRREYELTVIVYNKNRGEIVSKSDPEGRKTVYETLPKRFEHFIPIGRLDYASEGLLLLTDSPIVATALMESKLERVYNVKINGFVTKEMEEYMKSGLSIRGSKKGAQEKSDIENIDIAPFNAYQVIKNSPTYSKLKLVLTEGKNREIRRFFGHFDRDVLDLKRVSFAGIELNNLPNGKFRFLSNKEYLDLKNFIFKHEKPSKELSSK
ncbi:MAG: rRNA pseudouridine synthase [Campylobacterales bacterium]|nr:rRNA pseudouridine synthase [Campylobacterales bacterium]